MIKRLHAAPLVLAALLTGCADDLGPSSPELESSIFTLLGGLEVGESLSLSGATADSVYLAGGPDGAEYLYVPFFASEGGTARLQVELNGTNLRGADVSTFAAERLPAPSGEAWRPDFDRHERFLERTRREVEPRLARLPAPSRSRSVLPSRARAAAVVPRVGDLLPLTTNASCDAPDVRTGRVAAVGRSAIVVADTANPELGLTERDYADLARQYDELVHPTLTRAFGEPTDIDENARVVIFFTRAVNELTPPNSGSYVGGFFWAGDLFPRALCPGSNEAEIFYMLVADEAGEVNDNRFPTDFVRESSMGTIGHELQHLINAGRRIYVNDAETLEATWLNEGLSHIAEELLFYAASGVRPGQNVDLETIRSSETILRATNAYMFDNLVRFSFYLEQPELESLLGVDNLETRGASWAFLRYVSDHDPRSDEELFRRLVDTQYSGTENLTRVLGADVIDLMQAWTVSVFTDDHLSTSEARYQQPSWNFRSVVPALYRNPRFPLKVQTLGPDKEIQLRLRGGGAAFVRMTGVAGRQALISATSGGRTPPDRLRVSVVRLR